MMKTLIMVALVALAVGVAAEPAAAGPGGTCSYDNHPWLDDMCDGLFPWIVWECAENPPHC